MPDLGWIMQQKQKMDHAAEAEDGSCSRSRKWIMQQKQKYETHTGGLHETQ